MQNPYINKKMLPHDSDMFFGRIHEMRRIENSLNSEHPQSVSIVGERRIGKSSIANRIYHKFKNAENTVAVFLDCDGMDCDSQEDFFQILSREIADTGSKDKK
jgi:AAA+ ATPase superfamily predicted ATPase